MQLAVVVVRMVRGYWSLFRYGAPSLHFIYQGVSTVHCELLYNVTGGRGSGVDVHAFTLTMYAPLHYVTCV